MNKHHSSKSPPTPTSQLLFFLEPRQLNQSPPISGFFHPVRHRAHSLPRIGSVFWVIPILLGVNMLIHTYISSVQYLIESTYASHDSQVLSEEWPLRKVDVGFWEMEAYTWTQLESIYEISHHETSSFKRGHGCHGYPIPIKRYIKCSGGA